MGAYGVYLVSFLFCSRRGWGDEQDIKRAAAAMEEGPYERKEAADA